MSQVFVAVIGSSECTPEEALVAEAVGRELAKRGATVVCGGLGGVMKAASKGARSEGGRTIGILPGNSPAEANEYIEIPIVTGMGYARNVIVVKSAGAVIAIGGRFGTLSEIGHALQSGIPIIGLNTWSLSRGQREEKSIVTAQNPIEAVEKALTAAQRRLERKT